MCKLSWRVHFSQGRKGALHNTEELEKGCYLCLLPEKNILEHILTRDQEPSKTY